MPFKPSDSLLPLTPISFEVLLALLDGDLHGYAILQAVEARLAGKLPLRTGTMYRALARLMDEGLIERAGRAQEEDPRRRNYRITDARARDREGGSAPARRPGRCRTRPSAAAGVAGGEAASRRRALHRAALSPTRRSFRRQFGRELESVFDERLDQRAGPARRALCSPSIS